MTPPKDKTPEGVASLTPGQLRSVIAVLSGQARSHGSNFERASGIAHAAMDLTDEWLAAR